MVARVRTTGYAYHGTTKSDDQASSSSLRYLLLPAPLVLLYRASASPPSVYTFNPQQLLTKGYYCLGSGATAPDVQRTRRAFSLTRRLGQPALSLDLIARHQTRRRQSFAETLPATFAKPSHQTFKIVVWWHHQVLL